MLPTEGKPTKCAECRRAPKARPSANSWTGWLCPAFGSAKENVFDKSLGEKGGREGKGEEKRREEKEREGSQSWLPCQQAGAGGTLQRTALQGISLTGRRHSVWSVLSAEDRTVGPSRRSGRRSREQCPQRPCESHHQLGKPCVLVLEEFSAASAPRTEQLPAVAPVGPAHPQDRSDAASSACSSVCTNNGQFLIPPADVRLPARGVSKYLKSEMRSQNWFKPYDGVTPGSAEK